MLFSTKRMYQQCKEALQLYAAVQALCIELCAAAAHAHHTACYLMDIQDLSSGAR
jgi:hypothetical protein